MLCYVMLCYVMLCYVMLCYVMLCYVDRWKIHEEIHTLLDPPLDILFYNFTASYDGPEVDFT